jgi:hypothetical protein
VVFVERQKKERRGETSKPDSLLGSCGSEHVEWLLLPPPADEIFHGPFAHDHNTILLDLSFSLIKHTVVQAAYVQ